MTKVFISPTFSGEDRGDGGVRRIIEAQRLRLPEYGIEVVDSPLEADVLACHIIGSAGVFGRELADKPLVAHNHGFYWSGYEWGDWAGKDNAEVMRLVKAADIVTAPSEWVANIIRRQSARDVRVVYHGVDNFAQGPAANPPYVLWNKTRPDPICDPTPVRELARRLPQVAFHTTFWDMDGSGTAAGNVTILGRQPYQQALAEVGAAAVYLATSRETFGIGTLEAMAMGVPVVGFDWGGQQEIITHLQDGYLAKPGDYDDLARGVQWALAYRAQVGANGHVRALDFSWDSAMADYATIYEEAAARRAVHDRQPRVSVVVTAYNLARYLPACLATVQTQSMADWECIVVDDASPDNCGALAEVMAATDSRFRVIHNATNQYLPEARNIGIRNARGRYVLPLDADDLLAPRALEVLSHALDVDRQLHVAYGGVQFINDDGAPHAFQGRESDPGHSGWPVTFDFQTFMRAPGQPMPYASMFRIEAWHLTGGYRRRVRSSEDCDLFARMTSYGFRAAMVTQADTLIYRLRPDSMSAGGWADEENKAWFPWRFNPLLAPAASSDGVDVQVQATDPPVISIIIPVGPGHEQLVKDAVDSVDSQSYRLWECIVVNDTLGELPELPAWVQTLDYSSHIAQAAGVVAARNAGLELARGRFVLFLDADDFLMPNALDVMLQAERWAGGEAVIYSDFWEDPRDEGTFTVWQLPDYEPKILLQKALHSVTALYPLAAVRDVGGFTPDVPWEDWDLQLKLGQAGVCSRRVAAPLFAYRKHTGRRREDRYERREAGKADMLATWGDYIEGRKTMACASCGASGRPSTYYPAPARGGANFFNKPADMPDATLMEYTFAQSGKQQLRGNVTKQLYSFQAGRPRWVDNRDVPHFLSFQGMKVITAPDAPARIDGPEPAPPTEMPLRAPGPPPARGGAMTAERPVVLDAPPSMVTVSGVQELPTAPEAAGKSPLDLAVEAEERRQAERIAREAGAMPPSPAPADLPPPPAMALVESESSVAESTAAAEESTRAEEVTRVPLDESGSEVIAAASIPRELHRDRDRQLSQRSRRRARLEAALLPDPLAEERAALQRAADDD